MALSTYPPYQTPRGTTELLPGCAQFEEDYIASQAPSSSQHTTPSQMVLGLLRQDIRTAYAGFYEEAKRADFEDTRPDFFSIWINSYSQPPEELQQALKGHFDRYIVGVHERRRRIAQAAAQGTLQASLSSASYGPHGSYIVPVPVETPSLVPGCTPSSSQPSFMAGYDSIAWTTKDSWPRLADDTQAVNIETDGTANRDYDHTKTCNQPPGTESTLAPRTPDHAGRSADSTVAPRTPDHAGRSADSLLPSADLNTLSTSSLPLALSKGPSDGSVTSGESNGEHSSLGSKGTQTQPPSKLPSGDNVFADPSAPSVTMSKAAHRAVVGLGGLPDWVYCGVVRWEGGTSDAWPMSGEDILRRSRTKKAKTDRKAGGEGSSRSRTVRGDTFSDLRERWL
ncbi:hypothetical protein CF319_g9504, partial [Tilletia indica]